MCVRVSTLAVRLARVRAVDVIGMSALVVCAPGESRMWSLDTMLPVVLGSLSGLLLAVQDRSRELDGGGRDEDGDREVRR